MTSNRCCAVPICFRPGERFTRFPVKNPELFQLWLKQVDNPRLKDMDPARVYKSYHVCSKHFEDKWIIPCYNYASSKSVVKRNAVPTLFLRGKVNCMDLLEPPEIRNDLSATAVDHSYAKIETVVYANRNWLLESLKKKLNNPDTPIEQTDTNSSPKQSKVTQDNTTELPVINDEPEDVGQFSILYVNHPTRPKKRRLNNSNKNDLIHTDNCVVEKECNLCKNKGYYSVKCTFCKCIK